jgi:hypothetical protein
MVERELNRHDAKIAKEFLFDLGKSQAGGLRGTPRHSTQLVGAKRGR